MKKRYLALFMAAVTAFGSTAGSLTAVAESQPSAVLLEDIQDAALVTNDTEAATSGTESSAGETEKTTETELTTEPAVTEPGTEAVSEPSSEEEILTEEITEYETESTPAGETAEVESEEVVITDGSIVIEAVEVVEASANALEYNDGGEGEGEETPELYFSGLLEDHYTWYYYTNQEGLSDTVTVSLDNDSLQAVLGRLEQPENYGIKWEVGQMSGEEYTIVEGITIEVSAENQAAAELSFTDAAVDVRNLSVRASVYEDKEHMIDLEPIAIAEFGFEVRNPVYDYYFPEFGEQQLPGWEIGLGRYDTVRYYREDAEYPYGDEGTVELTDVQILLPDGENDNDPEVTEASQVAEVIEWEDGNGWTIRMNGYGYVIAKLFYQSVDNTETILDELQDIWVCGDVYSIDFSSDTDTFCLLPGAEATLIADVSWECYREGEGHFAGDTDELTVQWSITPENTQGGGIERNGGF